MKVIVTGAAGYIGGQTVLNLTDAGHEVFGIDLRVSTDQLARTGNTWWHIGDYATEVALTTIKQFAPDAIVHCAGTSLVGPSLFMPDLYYENNFVKTKTNQNLIVMVSVI